VVLGNLETVKLYRPMFVCIFWDSGDRVQGGPRRGCSSSKF